jgi:tetratricopeptide (TPR) repeat protein
MRRQEVERSLLKSGRPLYYSTMNQEVIPGESLIQKGFLYQAGHHPALRQGDESLWALYDFRGVPPWGQNSTTPLPDYRTRALVPYYAYQRCVQAGRAADWGSAYGFATSAQTVGPDVLWLSPNLIFQVYQWAQTNFQSGHLDWAELFFRLIAQWSPREASSWTNLGALEERRQNLPAAIEHYHHALDLDPTSETAHFNLAVAYWKRADWPRVIEEFQKVLDINPRNGPARNYLIQAQLRMGRKS